MSEYSKPLKKEKTKLGIKYWLKPRTSKPGRELLVAYDQKFPLADFKMSYSYYVRFLEQGNTAGNHYHQKKQEIFIPIEGELEVHLEDIASKEKEVIHLSAKDNVAFYVKAGLAHKVVSKNKTGVLLVLASSSSMEEDTFEYQIN